MYKTIIPIILVFLISCTTTTDITTTPVQQETEQQETPQTECNCDNDKICIKGICECPAGTKTCENTCIPYNSCCTNEDCPNSECQDNKCTTQKCQIGETYTPTGCQCDNNHYMCPKLNKCIPKGTCCRDEECASDERCTPVLTTTQLCIQTDNKKICKQLTDNGKTEIYTTEQDFRIRLEHYNNDGTTEITINNQTLEIPKTGHTPYQDINLYQESLKTFGGICKEDS